MKHFFRNVFHTKIDMKRNERLQCGFIYFFSVFSVSWNFEMKLDYFNSANFMWTLSIEHDYNK